MKKFVIAFVFLCCYAQLLAQKAEVIERYDRSAMTVYILDYAAPHKHHGKVVREFGKVRFQEKFDNNELDSRVLSIGNAQLPALTSMQATVIKAKLENERVANQIIAKWFDRQDDGTMGMEVIHQRGLYNATDLDMLVAGSSKRGVAGIKDHGLSLVNKSYIEVIAFQKVLSAKEAKVDSIMHGYRGEAVAFLFKVDMDQAQLDLLFDQMWIYDDDDASTREAKARRFDEHRFPIKFVAATSVAPNCLQSNKSIVYKDNETLFRDMLQKGYESSLYSFEKQVPDIRVRTSIHNVRPLRAKIGAKESLRRDQRFMVYEYVYNESTQGSDQRRVGAVRARRVADNRHVATGSATPSRFYQISGGALEPGMLLEQRNDFGLALQGRVHIGELGGAGAKATFNPNPMLGLLPVSQLKIWAAVAAQSKSYYAYGALADGFWLDDGYDYDFSFTRFGAGVSKGWYFARCLNLEISGGLAVEQATCGESGATTDDDTPVTLTGAYGMVGAELGWQLSPWLRAYGGADLHVATGVASFSDTGDTGYAYDQLFDGRSGLTINIGLSIEF